MVFEKKITEIERHPFTDGNGKSCIRVIKKIETPRQTFLKGDITGKYRGSLLDESDQYYKTTFYDFEIYEAIVENAITQKNTPFEDCNDKEFPREKLPEILKVTVLQLGQYFGVNIIEPKLCHFESNRKLHQVDGHEIFGTFKGVISGYILDYEETIIEEIVNNEVIINEPVDPDYCEASDIATGKVQRDGHYLRKEYYCKHHDDAVWGPWGYDGSKVSNANTDGCISGVFSSIGILLGLFFLFSILPLLIYIVPFVLLFLLFKFIGPYLRWIIGAIGVFLMIGFFISLFEQFYDSSSVHIPRTVVVDNPRELENAEVVEVQRTDREPNQEQVKDTLITRYRVWQDYEGNDYEGKYSLFASKIRASVNYKNNLAVNPNSEYEYDKILYSLKENDKDNLGSLYKLFDSIGQTNKLNSIKFAEMVVSFVQDMPYALLLENECDPQLYSDSFIKSYLNNPEAECNANQRFGIYTPLEFLYATQGDCDTRTLLLYTIFSKYDYDVVLLSSEHYGHSILGINLPYNGLSYSYNNQKYVLWETTALNAMPGIISQDISNLNFWRISLKSK